MSDNNPQASVPDPNAPQGEGTTPPPPPAPPAGEGYQPAPPPPAAAVGPGGPGPLVDRFLAKIIDSAIVWIPSMILYFIGAIAGGVFGWILGAIISIIIAAAVMGYFVYLESNSGQTVGKQLLKLRVVGPDGGNPDLEQAFRRNIWLGFTPAAMIINAFLGAIPILGFILGLLISMAASIGGLIAVIMIAVGINSDAVNRQAWHDKFAGGTRVIKTE